MKKEMLSLNSWIKEAAEWQQPLDEFLIDYNMRELECSQEDLLAVMPKSWLQPQVPKALLIFWARRP